MSEPTWKDALEEAYALRDKFSEYGESLYGDELAKLITEVRTQATNDALEQAANICKQHESGWTAKGLNRPEDARGECFARAATALQCENEIRAMKVPT